MRRPLRLTAVAASTTLVLALTACTSDEDDSLGMGDVTIAVHNDLPGVSYSENYARSGFDVAVAASLKRHFEDEEFTAEVDVSSADRETQLKEHEADLTIASYSITRDRMAEIDFAGPYLETYQGFLVREDSGITEREDLRNKVVCVWDGTTSLKTLEELKVPVETAVLTDASDCVNRLLEGKVDAFSTDQAILYGFAKYHEQEKLRVVPGLTIGAPQRYGIGMRKENRDACEKLAEWLKDYVRSSEWLRDLREELPGLAASVRDVSSDFRPGSTAIQGRSCRDKPSP